MKVVASSASSALTPAARSLKPSTRPPSARKKTLRSSSRSTPVRRLRTEKTTLVPRPTTRAARPVGARKTRSARPSRKPVRRSGASRKSSALRDGGVSRTSDVEAPRAVELVELGHRGELLRARDGAGELLVDAVGEDLVARALVGREALDQLVEGALGVEHHRPQLAAHLDAVAGEARGVDEVRLVAQLVDAQRVGQPARGVDGDDRDARALARPGPWPAPPTSSSCPRRPSPRRRRCACRARRALTARAPARAPGAASRVAARRRRERQRRDRGARAGGAGAAAARAGRRPARGRGAPRGPRVRRAPPSSARSVGGGEALGQHAVADHEARPRGRRSSRSASCRASVSLTGISSGRATATTPVRSGSETIASIVRPWRAMRPTRAVWAKVRGALSTATPWPVAGASRTTRS